MIDLFKRDHKRKIYDSKDEDQSIGCRFIFESVAYLNYTGVITSLF